MRLMQKALYRCFHYVAKGVLWLITFPQPKLLTGAHAIESLPEIVKDKADKILIVTDRQIVKLGLMDTLIKGLKEKGVDYCIYDEVTPNPTISSIEKGLELYVAEQCQGLLAFGGGSPIDCCKVIGARIVNPSKSVKDMSGYLKVRRRLPPFFVVPTTSGTGSETTLAAVITDEKEHNKFVVADFKLVPAVAVLDPLITLKLPKSLTATTGMDALTHGVEAYIGKHKMSVINRASSNCVIIIMRQLTDVYDEGDNVGARYQMALASYYGGLAFTKASVGNVHALAHQLGGVYGIPHGLANAVLLPVVLRHYGKAVYKDLAYFARICNLTSHSDDDKSMAMAFIEKIENMNTYMNIPKGFSEIKEEDFSLMAERALEEANPKYPVPVIFEKKDFIEILHQVKGLHQAKELA